MSGAANICGKCAHRETCQVPCAPVEAYLRYENRTTFERTATLSTGEEVQIIFSLPRTIREADFRPISDKSRDQAVDLLDRGENPFAGFEPSLKQTGIFIDRFFHHWSYEDLAVKYDLTPSQVSKIYWYAVDRLKTLMEALDGQDKSIHNFEPWKQMVEKRSGAFPEGVRLYLLNKLFQLRPAEIAKLEGKQPHAVRGMIIRVSDQLRCGEISLFLKDPEEAEAAKARLDSKRKKRREKYVLKKSHER